jgi:hypothetical protein
MLDEGAVAHADLAALEHRRHGHDDGELSQLALVVVGHGEHGLVVVAGEHHLGGAVEELGVGLGDVEPAERQGGRGPRDGERGGDDSGDGDLHGALVSWASPAPAVGCHW